MWVRGTSNWWEKASKRADDVIIAGIEYDFHWNGEGKMVGNRSSKSYTRLLMLALWAAVFFLAAGCRRLGAEVQATLQPTLTITPRSTALPSLATAVPLGEADNPLQMIIHPEGGIKAVQGSATDFEDAVKNESGLIIQVKLVERYAEALAALCDSSGGTIAVAWLDGLSYTAALAQNCGQPLMQVKRGSGSNASTGQAVSIIIKKDANISSVSALKNKTFCRIGYNDSSSWLLPSLILQAHSVDPLSLKAVNDYADVPKLVEAVAGGDCDAAGIAADALKLFASDIGDAADKVKTLETSIDFPYAILVVPIEVPLGMRLSLTNTLTKLAQNSATAVKMRALLGQNALIAASGDDFTELADFMASTGLNFAQLGN
jgi:ABC-type phosphate/phosphonate transport system substrate-binding protein